MVSLRFSAICLGICVAFSGHAQKKEIYHKGWIDFNKNGRKDIYEDPAQPVEKRVEDLLSQMTVEEKTCQLATLYGYGRVLRDSLPVEAWKQEIWKDGIGNIDEMLNGVGGKSSRVPHLLYPFSNHAEAINAVQRWFVEETRLGIPVDFSNEGIHGLNHTKATPLPAPIAIGSTWNRDLVYQAGEIAGQEASVPKTVGQIELNFPFKPGSHGGQPAYGPNGTGNTRVLGELYPFGYGLSYTTFEYSHLEVTPLRQSTQGIYTVTCRITNTGSCAGDEVVQLYVRDKVGSVIPYDSVLRGFERISLQPGETKQVTFRITPEDLQLLDSHMQWTVEPGEFEFLVGASSQDIRLRQTVTALP